MSFIKSLFSFFISNVFLGFLTDCLPFLELFNFDFFFRLLLTVVLSINFLLVLFNNSYELQNVVIFFSFLVSNDILFICFIKLIFDL